MAGLPGQPHSGIWGGRRENVARPCDVELPTRGEHAAGTPAPRRRYDENVLFRGWVANQRRSSREKRPPQRQLVLDRQREIQTRPAWRAFFCIGRAMFPWPLGETVRP